MTDIWAVWPSANPELAAENSARWHDAGYKTAVLFDRGTRWERSPADRIILNCSDYLGFPHSINQLCHEVPGEVVVCAGDDVHPPDVPPAGLRMIFLDFFPDTFGVIQPTGDKFGSIETAAVCPWIGRAFIDEAYGGAGPYFEEYFHYFCDQELQEVATLLGAFKQLPEITQYHDHWQRDGGERPPHLMKAKDRWEEDRDIFEIRQRHRFPECERGFFKRGDI
jgi:hypothetical protein